MTSRKDMKLSSDDLLVWRKVAETVKPLPNHYDIETLQEILDGPPKPTEPVRSLSAAMATPVKIKKAPVLPELGVGQVAGMDRRTGERMKRGALSIEGRIDLHGMTRDQAQLRLFNFIVNGYEQGKRSILVITGKGQGGTGILKSEVPRWLNLPPIREKVLGFSYAQPKDGGDGALYVLLRRHRT